jgi:O-antigen/teichoic acid export membrane protein
MTADAPEAGLGPKIRAAALEVSFWQVGSSLLAAAANILLARTLGARLLGAYAVSAFVLTFVGFFIDFGMQNCLIRRPRPAGPDFLKTAFTLTLLFTLAWSLIVWLALAPLAAAWYRDPDVHTLMSLGMLGLAVSSCFKLSQGLLEKDLEYRSVMTGEFLGSLGLYLPSMLLATLGYGVLALAAGEICRGLAAVYWFAKRPFKAGLRLDRAAAREILAFGAGYLGMLLSWANLAALNPIVVGKLAGLEAAGIIRQAEGLANHLTFLKRIGERLAYPALARLQESRSAVVGAVETGRLYQFLLGAWPLFALTATARWLVPLLYGPRWLPVANVFPILSLTIAVNTLFGLYSAALVTVGRSADVTRFSLAYSAVLWVVDPLLVARFGYLGHPLAAVFAIPAYTLVHRAFAARFGPIGYARLLRTLLPAWALGVIAWCLPPVWGVALFVGGHALLLALDAHLRGALRELPRAVGAREAS